MWVICIAVVVLWLGLIVWEIAKPQRDVPGSRAAALEGLLVVVVSVALVVATAPAGGAPAAATPWVRPTGLSGALRQVPVGVLWADACVALALGLWTWHLFGGGAVLLVRLEPRRSRQWYRAYLKWVRTPVGRACRVLFGGAVGFATLYCMLLRRTLLYLWV
jgi:hypothetical protein